MMVYIRRKKIKGKNYHYLVQSIRQNGKIKQKVIKYLGTTDSILEKYKFWEEHH